VIPDDCLESGRSCQYTCPQNLLRCTSQNRTHDAGWCLSLSPRPPPQSVKDSNHSENASSTATRAATAFVSSPCLLSLFTLCDNLQEHQILTTYSPLLLPPSLPTHLSSTLPHSPLLHPPSLPTHPSSTLPHSPLTSPPPSLPTHLSKLHKVISYGLLRHASGNTTHKYLLGTILQCLCVCEGVKAQKCGVKVRLYEQT